MPRRAGSKNSRTVELEKLWDRYARQYQHPVEFLFQLMTGQITQTLRDKDGNTLEQPATIEQRAQAAIALQRYRFPVYGVISDDNGKAPSQLVLTWDDPANHEGHADGREIPATLSVN